MADDTSSNQYIRTYAKDVAALTGKDPDAVKNSPVSEARPEVVAPSEEAPAAPKADAGADREAVLARLRDRAAKDPVHESQLLPPSLPTPVAKAEPVQSAPVPEAPPEPLPPPPEKVEPIPSANLMAPIVPSPIVMPTTEPVELPKVTPVSVVAPPPLPPAPEPVTPPAPPAAPSELTFTHAPREFLSREPVAPPEFVPPAAPVIPPAPVSLENVSPIHTYTSDFSDRIDTKSASTFSVLAAESDAHAAPPPPSAPKRSRNILIIAGGIVLVLIALGGAYGAYWYVSKHAPIAAILPVPSLVFADDRQALSGEGGTLLGALADSAATPLDDGKVRVVYLTEATTTASGATEQIPLSGGRLFGALQLSAPDVLLRNIGPETTVGIVHAGPETRAFFILRVLSYESTFAGMLAWENGMQTSLSLLYPTYPAPEAPAPTIATTTVIVHGKRTVATTTVAAPPVVYVAPHFVDEVAANHDVRALKDGAGRTILLYGYVDKQTLVIARDEAAFGELVNRLSATKQQ